MIAKRVQAETAICELVDRIEGTKDGYNAQKYKAEFKNMSDTDFNKFMKNLKDDPDFNLFFEIDSMNEKNAVSMARIQQVANFYHIPLTEYVAFPHKNPLNPDQPVITKTPVIKLIIPVRRLQQFLDKKNSASANTDQVNPITGQVTGDSKAASLSDTQTCSLATTNMKYTIKELLGPRADDQTSKIKMIEAIEKYGTVSLADLNLKTKDKQSILTMEVFLRGAGLMSSLLRQDELNAKRDEDAAKAKK